MSRVERDPSRVLARWRRWRALPFSRKRRRLDLRLSRWRERDGVRATGVEHRTAHRVALTRRAERDDLSRKRER